MSETLKLPNGVTVEVSLSKIRSEEGDGERIFVEIGKWAKIIHFGVEGDSLTVNGFSEFGHWGSSLSWEIKGWQELDDIDTPLPSANTLPPNMKSWLSYDFSRFSDELILEGLMEEEPPIDGLWPLNAKRFRSTWEALDYLEKRGVFEIKMRDDEYFYKLSTKWGEITSKLVGNKSVDMKTE